VSRAARRRFATHSRWRCCPALQHVAPPVQRE
jgi:hypothetical protein